MVLIPEIDVIHYIKFKYTIICNMKNAINKMIYLILPRRKSWLILIDRFKCIYAFVIFIIYYTFSYTRKFQKNKNVMRIILDGILIDTHILEYYSKSII